MEAMGIEAASGAGELPGRMAPALVGLA